MGENVQWEPPRPEVMVIKMWERRLLTGNNIIIISTIISGGSCNVGVKQPDIGKGSSYECGFEPFGNPRVPFFS